MAVTKRELLGLSPGSGVWADATTRARPVAHERREAKSVIAPVPRLRPVRDDHASKKNESRARVYCVRVILPDGPPPTHGTPLADAPFVARIFGRVQPGTEGTQTRTVHGKTDADGVLRLPLHDGEHRLVLEIAGRAIKVRAGALVQLDAADAPDEQVKLRLYNLGYGATLPDAWDEAEYKFLLALFQKQHGVAEEEWEKVGPDTLRALRRHHDGEG